MEKIDTHAVSFFLSRYASVPRCTYLMRAALTFMAIQQLRAIDEGMCAAIMRTCNVSLSNDNWIQASLTIYLGDIGVRRMEDVALPVYIFMSATQSLVCQINGRTRDGISGLLLTALPTFTEHQCPDVDLNALNDAARISQRQLDEATSRRHLDELLERSNQVDRARLLAASESHSGAWLEALLVLCLGLLLPDDAVRAGVAH